MKVSFSEHTGKTPDIRQRTFSFKKKEWPDEDNFQKMKIEDSNGGAEYSEKLRILSGREHPELFLFWLENYRNKVLKNIGIDYKTKMSILRTLCKDDAQATIRRSIAKTSGRLNNPGENLLDVPADRVPLPNTFVFENIPIATKLSQLGQEEWLDYVNDDTILGWQADQITECIHALKGTIYGTDSYGRNIYTKLKKQMRNSKINFIDGIRKWANRMNDYQTYLPDMLWESGEAVSRPITKFSEMDMREILENALTKVHEAHLQRIDWECLDEEYSETVSKLESMEQMIIRDNAMEKRLSSMEETVGKRSTTTSKSSYSKCKTCGKMHPGECRMKGKEGKQTYEKCKHCGKKHPGECWSKGGKPDGKSNSKRKWGNKELVAMMKAFQQKNSDSDSESSEEESWQKGKTEAQVAYVMGAAQADQDSDDISIDSSTAKKYLKRYKKNRKRRKL